MYIQHEILVIYWGAEKGHNYWQFIPLYGKKVNISTLCQYIDTAGQSDVAALEGVGLTNGPHFLKIDYW